MQARDTGPLTPSRPPLSTTPYHVPCRNPEFRAPFTVSVFPWAKSSSARQKKAPCWQRMATAMAAPTRVFNRPKLNPSWAGLRCTCLSLGAGGGDDIRPQWPSLHALLRQPLIKRRKKKKKKDSCVRSEGALQRPIMGTCVASMIVPTAHMPFPPPRARGEGAVTSLLRMLGTAATKALNGPVAEIVLTARRARIGAAGQV